MSTYVNDHAICLELARKYFISILNDEKFMETMKTRNFITQLEKYGYKHIPGDSPSGKIWVSHFLNEIIPEYMQKEENE